MKTIKTCACCQKEFTLEDITKLVKENEKPLYDADGVLCLYLFDCPCHSTLAIKFDVIQISEKGERS